MPLQPYHIDELKQLYKAEFHNDLTEDEAWAMAIRLIDFFRILYDERVADDDPK